MSAKHTPGPWFWRANHSGGARVEAPGVGVADVLSRAGVAYPVEETCKANARLISAVPELLAALESLVATIEDEVDINATGGPNMAMRLLNEHGAAVRNALKKARGE